MDPENELRLKIYCFLWAAFLIWTIFLVLDHVSAKDIKLSEPHYFFDGDGRKQLVRAI